MYFNTVEKKSLRILQFFWYIMKPVNWEMKMGQEDNIPLHDGFTLVEQCSSAIGSC